MGRYQDYLHADAGYSFAQYLGIALPQLEYGDFIYGGTGSVRYTSPRGAGEWCITMKAARASYRADMFRRKREERQERLRPFASHTSAEQAHGASGAAPSN